MLHSQHIFYKDGSRVSYTAQLETTMWHRGVYITKKSRKSFTCACGCNIPQASTYLTLEMISGSVCGSFLVDFALCSDHQKETEALLGQSISTGVNTADIINAWYKILQTESDVCKVKAQPEISNQDNTLDALVVLRSYSWEIRSEICAVKTVDKTLRYEGSTGIPMDVVSFFTGQPLVEGQEQTLEFSILDALVQCVISRKQGRHRLFLVPLKQKLIQLGIQIGDLLFFERDLVVAGRFFVSALSQKNEIVAQLSSFVPLGKESVVYTTARIGQEFFREQVRFTYNYRCCLSGIDDTKPSILIASHIKPWKESSGEEKTDKFNGLLLAPHYDKLFDKGLISFSDTGNIMFSPLLSNHLIQEWGLEGKKLTTVHRNTAAYLAFHRGYFGF